MNPLVEFFSITVCFGAAAAISAAEPRLLAAAQAVGGIGLKLQAVRPVRVRKSHHRYARRLAPPRQGGDGRDQRLHAGLAMAPRRANPSTISTTNRTVAAGSKESRDREGRALSLSWELSGERRRLADKRGFFLQLHILRLL